MVKKRCKKCLYDLFSGWRYLWGHQRETFPPLQDEVFLEDLVLNLNRNLSYKGMTKMSWILTMAIFSFYLVRSKTSRVRIMWPLRLTTGIGVGKGVFLQWINFNRVCADDEVLRLQILESNQKPTSYKI